MASPTISIIVPVYNTKQYLGNCINSILSQTYTDFELLLVDDGSPDGSGDICDEYAAKDERVKVFHKENGGVSSARNLGLDNARGEWVCFIDSDDYIGHNYFEDVLEYGSYDLITISFQEFGAACSTNGSKATIVYSMPEDAHKVLNFSPNDKSMTPYLSSCVHLMRKSIIDTYQIRFNSALRYGEDTLFVAKYLTHCKKIIQLPDIHYYYRIEENAFMRKYKLSAEEANIHCKALTETMDEYCTTLGCTMPQVYYSNFVTYLKAFDNYLRDINDFGRFKQTLKSLGIPYRQLRYAGRQLPVKVYLMRLFPHLSFSLFMNR